MSEPKELTKWFVVIAGRGISEDTLALIEARGGSIQAKVSKKTRVMLVGKLRSDAGPKLNQAQKHRIKMVSEAVLLESLRRGGWEAVLVAPDNVVCRKRCTTQGRRLNEAHLAKPAVLDAGCEVGPTFAYADALGCLAACPRSTATAAGVGEARRYCPTPLDNFDCYSQYHAWGQPGIESYFYEPQNCLYDPSLLSEVHTAKALRVCNEKAGILGEIMQRLRQCGVCPNNYTRNYVVPTLDTVTGFVAHALQLRRTAAAACEAIACHAAGDPEGAREVCRIHDNYEKGVARTCPIGNGWVDIYRNQLVDPTHQYNISLVESNCFDLPKANVEGTLAAAPLALVLLLDPNGMHGLCGLPCGPLGDLVRFLCRNLTDMPASAALVAILPHLQARLWSVPLEQYIKSCDVELATQAAFGCPAAVITLTQPGAQGPESTKRLAKNALGPEAWGACLPGHLCRPTITVQDAESRARREKDMRRPWTRDGEPIATRKDLMVGGVALLALIVAHLEYLARPHRSPNVSKLADAIATNGVANAEDTTHLGQRKIHVRRIPAPPASDESRTEDEARLDAVRQQSWYQMRRLAMADTRCTEPRGARRFNDEHYTFHIASQSAWVGLEAEVATRRAEIEATPERLRAHMRICARLYRCLRPTMRQLTCKAYLKCVTKTLSFEGHSDKLKVLKDQVERLKLNKKTPKMVIEWFAQLAQMCMQAV